MWENIKIKQLATGLGKKHNPERRERASKGKISRLH